MKLISFMNINTRGTWGEREREREWTFLGNVSMHPQRINVGPCDPLGEQVKVCVCV